MTALPSPLARPFSFVLISDRTGGARPGVFERGLAVTDLLAPAFAVQLGDLIEGYTDDLAEIEQQWDQIDAMVAATHTPVWRVPGNHDVASPLQLKVWQQRYGSTWSWQRVDDVLFVLLDTQDPPAEYERAAASPQPSVATPAQQRAALERSHDWDASPPAALGDEQLAEVEAVLDDHRDVRWTFLCMHMPLWQGQHPSWEPLRRRLGGRRYTAFAGHVHNYRHELRDGRSHIRLGPTGGAWVLPGPDGNFDHVTQVTLTDRGPVLANVLLDGVRDVDGEPLLPVATRTVPIS